MKRYTAEILSQTTGLQVLGATLEVFLPGTQTRALLYSADDRMSALVSQPVPNGVSFYPENGSYDLVARNGVRTTTLLDVDIYDLSETVRGPIGETGPANSTYTSLADLKAAPTASKSYTLVTSTGRTEYAYVTGNFTGRADDVNVVKLDAVPLTTGALVRQSGASISRKGQSASMLIRDADNVENQRYANAFDYIPATNHNAIMARTSSYDATGDLQKLVNENQRWQAPRGRFFVSGAGVLLPAGSYGSGAGIGRTVFKKTSDQDSQAFRINGANGVTLEDFDIDGSRSQSSTYDVYKFCLYASSASDLTLRRVSAFGATTDNITLELCRNPLLSEIRTFNCNKQGIYLSSCDAAQINLVRGIGNGCTGGQTGAGAPQLVGSALAIACTWDVSTVGLYSAGNVQSDVIFGRGSRNLVFDSTCVLGDTYNGRSGVASVIGIAEAISGVVHGQTYNGSAYGTDQIRFLGSVINGRVILELANDVLFDGGVVDADPTSGSAINLLGCSNVRVANEIRNWNLVGIAMFDSDKNGGKVNDNIFSDAVRYRNNASSTLFYDYSGHSTNLRQQDSLFNGALVEVTSSRANKASIASAAAPGAAGATATGAELNALAAFINANFARLKNGAPA